MQTRLRNFVFTINNWNDSDYESVKNLDYLYLIIGKEIGKSGTPHLQGYCELSKQYAFNIIKSKIKTAHIEPRRGTADEAADYCKKEGDYQEFGLRRKQGKRSDIETTYELAKKNTSMIDFLETKPNFQNIRIFEIAKTIYQPDRTFKPHVEWIYGSTGTGKTRYVVEKEPNLWISGKNLKWWLGYENQEATLFDDFRGDFCTFHELLRILDRYPYNVEVKGGHRKLNSKRMYITCPDHPSVIYPSIVVEDRQQLLRRIDTITQLGEERVNSKVLTQKSGGNTSPPTFWLDDHLKKNS